MSDDPRSDQPDSQHQPLAEWSDASLLERKRMIYTLLRPITGLVGVRLPRLPDPSADRPPSPPGKRKKGRKEAANKGDTLVEDLLPLTTQDDQGDVPLSRGGFLYEGKGYTPEEFVKYVENYDFGSVPPNFIVLHHTYRPSISTASAGAQYDWDAGEAGMSARQVYAKRKRRLDNLKEYYRRNLGWDRGPHLFIDDRYIWTFTPMYHVGIHAAQGNGAVPNYSIGIEVIGYYERHQWAPQIAYNVGIAVAAIKRKIGTFEYIYKRGPGGISSHRDYNKPSCPGAAITEQFYLQVLKEGWENLQRLGGAAPEPTPAPQPAPAPAPKPTPPAASGPVTLDSPIIGAATGTQQQTVQYITERLPSTSEYKNDVDLIMSYYWKYAPPVGVDPFIAACQCIFETDSLKSYWAARPRRNPAGLGVHDEGGLSFATWEQGVQAHIGQLLALALRDDETNNAQKQMMQRNPRHRHIAASVRGTAKTIGALSGRWTNNAEYGKNLLTRLLDVRGEADAERNVKPGGTIQPRPSAESRQPTPPAATRYSEHSPIIATSSATQDQAVAYILSRRHGEYTEQDIRDVIVPTYFELCTSAGVDPVIAIAQMIHETGNLTSFWASRPQRNPAGIGVTGQKQTYRPFSTNNWAYNTQRRLWEAGLSFATWEKDAIPAHVGRLAAYALASRVRSAAQRALIDRALAYRMLPDHIQGSATTIKLLGRVHNPSGSGWASPGTHYGARIAEIAQHILEMPRSDDRNFFIGISPTTDELEPEEEDEAENDIPYAELLPLESEEDLGDVPLSRGAFLYEGKGYTRDEFVRYVESYNFGTIPPNFIVLHHTFRPSISTASAGAQYDWDAGEAGMTDAQIYSKRKRRLDGLKEYYRRNLGWDRGPHLFIDDRYIWTFTPMFHVGIHAAQGNGAVPNYSIGIEVIGYYEHHQWAPPIAHNVGIAVAAIKRKINTFDYIYRPGPGGISSHRDYNKPSCPGAAITESFYLQVLKEGWSKLNSGAIDSGVVAPEPPAPEPLPDLKPATDLTSIIGSGTGTQAHAVAYIKQRLSTDSEYKNDVDLIMSYYWKYAPPVGVDPFIAACQCIFETDSLKSYWAARPRRNPAGLGVHDEGGLSFATWDESVQAHIGQLLAFALRDDEANDAQKQMMRRNPRHGRIKIIMRGSGRTVGGLNSRWVSDDPQYGTKLLRRILDIQKGD